MFEHRQLTFSCSLSVMLTPAFCAPVPDLLLASRATLGLSLSHFLSPSLPSSSSKLSSSHSAFLSVALGVFASSSVPRLTRPLFGVEGLPELVELVIVVDPSNDRGGGCVVSDRGGLLNDSSSEPRLMSGIVLDESWLSSLMPKLSRWYAI